MAVAQRSRSVASTAMNAQSSRSHSVFTLWLTGTDASTGTTLKVRAVYPLWCRQDSLCRRLDRGCGRRDVFFLCVYDHPANGVQGWSVVCEEFILGDMFR